MKYRMPNELIDLVAVASSQKVDLSRHATPNYDVDELNAYITGNFKENEYKINDRHVISSGYSGPHEVYRVFTVNFTDAGQITLFGDHIKAEKEYVIIKASEYEELTKKPEETTEPSPEDKPAEPKVVVDPDEPIDLDNIPF